MQLSSRRALIALAFGGAALACGSDAPDWAEEASETYLPRATSLADQVVARCAGGDLGAFTEAETADLAPDRRVLQVTAVCARPVSFGGFGGDLVQLRPLDASDTPGGFAAFVEREHGEHHAERVSLRSDGGAIEIIVQRPLEPGYAEVKMVVAESAREPTGS